MMRFAALPLLLLSLLIPVMTAMAAEAEPAAEAKHAEAKPAAEVKPAAETKQSAKTFCRLERDRHFAQARELIARYEEAEPGDKNAEKDLKKAVQLLRESVKGGNDGAMLQLAMLYRKGIGVPQSDEEALKLLKLAAEKKNGRALMDLGFYYRMKEHRDDELAAQYFCQALELGFPGAGLQFGALCHAGIGMERDPARAASAFRADALRGHAKAQNIYGVLLFKGDGVPRDIERGKEMIRLSAKQGFAPAICNLAVITRAEGGAANSAEAERLFKRAAEQGFTPAYRNLALMLLDKTGASDEDYQAAFRFASEAAKRSDAPALHILGLIEWLGYGRPADTAKAFAFFLRSAEKGFPPACLQVADMYAKGEGVKADPEAAERWLKKARERFSGEDIQLLTAPAAPSAPRKPDGRK